MLYDNKLYLREESAQYINYLKSKMKAIDCTISTTRGDYKGDV